jgi:hypothetical protein
MNIKTNFKFVLLFGIFLISSTVWNHVQAQIAPNAGVSIKINTPVDSDTVPVGDLTIQGTSSDDDTKNCQVYADWNDLKPMQNVTPSGSKGNADYSSWSFTYTGSYHNIVEGPNELTSKITCYDQGQNASTKFYSVNVTGTTDRSENANNTVQTSNKNTDNDVSNVLPVKNNNSNSADNTVQTSNKNTDNDVSISNVLPVKNNNSNSADNTIQTSNKNTDNDVSISNVLPVKKNNSNSADNTVEKSNKNTDNDVSISNVLPVKNNNSKGTYKILPLYSESNEESAHTVASQDKDKTEEVTSTDTSESQVSDNTEELNDTDANTYSTYETEQLEQTGQTTTADMSQSQVSDNTEELNDTDANTYSTYETEQLEQTGETTTTDMSKSQVTDSADEALSTDTNTYFIFEPEQVEDEELSAHNENTISKSPQSDNPLPDYYHDDGNSVFGLNFKNVDDDTEDKLGNRMEKLKERVADDTHLFDQIG